MPVLSDADRTLWAAVARTVTPLGERARPPGSPAAPLVAVRRAALPTTPDVSHRPRQPVQLDGGWERRLTKGQVEPDHTLDLHGLRLETAWDQLESTVAGMIGRGGRVLLVIAGRDRGPDVRHQPGARGRIRATLPHWLHDSRHADRIAAVRPAHARHGGAGAVYVVLRRERSDGSRMRR